MTQIIDYKKAYEEALERAREMYNRTLDGNPRSFVGDYEYIFPQLKETSDDDRIVEKLSAILRVCCTKGAKVDEYVEWLEKHKNYYISDAEIGKLRQCAVILKDWQDEQEGYYDKYTDWSSWLEIFIDKLTTDRK